MFLDNEDLLSLYRLADYFIMDNLVEILKGTILDRLSVLCFDLPEWEALGDLVRALDTYPVKALF